MKILSVLLSFQLPIYLVNAFFNGDIHYKYNRIITSYSTRIDITFDLERIINAGYPKAHLATTEIYPYTRPERRRPKYDAPIIVIPEFLSETECNEIIRVGSDLESRGIVADLYLNHRINKVLEKDNSSEEALKLIQEQNLSEEELAADCLSGFRASLPPSILLSGKSLTDGLPRGTPVIAPIDSIGQKVLTLLGCQDRKISFLDDLWVNPTQDKIMIRDQTTVHYRQGEGVPPHVDGNSVTVLVYLNDMEINTGGRTIFPEAGIASIPKKGSALIYCSKGQKLLHFAERVKKNEKWVMQLLIDHLYRKDLTSNFK